MKKYNDLITECLTGNNQEAKGTAEFYIKYFNGDYYPVITIKFTYEQAIITMQNALALTPKQQQEMKAVNDNIIAEIEPIFASIASIENNKN